MQRFVHRSNGWSLTPAARVVAGILAFSLSGCLGLDEVTCVDVSECATGEACLAGVCQTADSGGGGDVDADTDDGITPDAPDADDTSDVPEDVADSGDTAPDGDTDDRDVNDAADATDTADSGDAADAADSDGSSDTDATDGSGACEARNACGGCEVLSDVPGSDCGPCDLDQIVCVGTDGVECSGATECDGVALITLGAEDVTATSFTITAAVSLDAGESLTDHGICIDNGPSPSIDFDDCVRLGPLSSTRSFEAAFEDLDPARLYFARAFVVGEAVQYGNELQLRTAPEAPTNVTATEGELSASVLVRWAPVDNANEYVVYRDGIEITSVATTEFNDDTAEAGGPPVLLPEGVQATQGTLVGQTRVTWLPALTVAGPAYEYEVSAIFEGVESELSAPAVGFRGGDPVAGYEVSIDGGDFIDVAALLEYVHNPAPPGILLGGTASASDGTSSAVVSLTLTGFGHEDQPVEYVVRAYTIDAVPGESVDVSGYAGVGDITIQWQRRVGSSPFSNINGVTGAVASDSPPDGASYDYRARLSASSLTATSTSDIGFIDAGVPTVETLPVTSVTSTSATFNLSSGVTTNTLGFCYSATNTAPVQGDAASTCASFTTLGVGRSNNVSGLQAGTRYFVRAYSTTVLTGVTGYGASVTFITIPPVVTGVQASDGNFAAFVQVTWSEARGASQYQVLRNGTTIATINGTTFQDTAAPASSVPTMQGVAFSASTSFPVFVRLTWGAPSVANGESRTYTVLAVNESGSSSASAGDAGFRGAAAISSYEVELPAIGGGLEWRDVGPELTWDDSTAPAGALVTGTPTATLGTWERFVRLSTTDATRAPGAGRNYRVRARIGVASGTPSGSVTGTRAPSGPTYQWQRLNASSVWVNIADATSQTYNDTAAAITPSVSRYRVVASATGAESVVSAEVQGARSSQRLIEDIQAGGSHTCALFSDGTVRCWGSNNAGQLGYPGRTVVGNSLSDFPIPPLDLGGPASAIAVGDQHNCALVDENVVCWGNGGNGRLGTGSTGNVGLASGTMPPTNVRGLSGVPMQITAGAAHTCALLDSGDVQCWGSNSNGALGHAGVGDYGDTAGETLPLVGFPPPILGRTVEVSSISTGGSGNCAIEEGGAVYCWGANSSGRFCAGASPSIPPTLMAWGLGRDASAQSVWLSSNTLCATDGSVVGCAGSNTSGQLGSGNALNQCTGTTIRTLREIAWLEDIVDNMSLSGTHTCALAKGSVHCYGRAAEGQVGNGDPAENLGDESDEVPVPVVALPPGVVTDVTVGSSHSCAVLDARDIYCWGRAADGRLGNGNATNNVGDAVGEMPPTMTMLR